MPKLAVQTLLSDIKDGNIKNWNEVHQFYQQNGKVYAEQKLQHALASLLEINKTGSKNFTVQMFSSLLQQAVQTKTWMVANIHESRAKDYQNEFRKMIYDNDMEMDNVLGKLEDNVFINQQQQELEEFKIKVSEISARFSLT